MRALKVHDDLQSIPIDNLKHHYVLMFDLISIQGATEHCHYSGWIGEPLRLELNLNGALGSVTEVKILGEQLSLVAVDKSSALGEKFENG